MFVRLAQDSSPAFFQHLQRFLQLIIHILIVVCVAVKLADHVRLDTDPVDIVAFRSCGTRVAFAAMNIAAPAGAKPYAPRNAVNTVL